MRSIAAVVEERTDITSNWTTINPVLAQYQTGYEFANDGVTPVGVKLGDGATMWSALPYWFLSSGFSNAIIAKSSGIALPIVFTSFQTLYSRFGRFPKFQFVKVIDNGDYTFSYQYLTANSIVTKEITAGKPDSITINVNDDGTGHLQDNILIIISN